MYQQISLPSTLVGAPGPLPANLVGLTDSVLSDLSAHIDPPPIGYGGQGFWPVTLTTPSYDATAQIPDGTYAYAADPPTKTVAGTADLRALTSAELAANLTAAQQTKISALTASCQAQIVGGYTSSALGTPYTYPSLPTDQANMTASVVRSGLPSIPSNWTTPFWCQSQATSAWAMVSHTIAQIQQAGSDGFSAISAAQTKLATLSAEVMAATTIAAVNAISW